VPKSLNTSCDI